MGVIVRNFELDRIGSDRTDQLRTCRGPPPPSVCRIIVVIFIVIVVAAFGLVWCVCVVVDVPALLALLPAKVDNEKLYIQSYIYILFF